MKKRLITVILMLILLMNSTLTAFAAEPKLVALTFDDGPSTQYTEKLLDGLRERGAKATFFVMGNSLKDPNGDTILKNAAIVERAHLEGHQIGSHTYSHPHLTRISHAEAMSELIDTDSYLREILGSGSYFIRPPYGEYNENISRLAQEPLILWSMDPAWEAPKTDAGSQHRYIINHVADGDIILLHDRKETDVQTALMVIDSLKQQGYEFVTVGELMRLRNVTPQKGAVYKAIPEAVPFDEAQLSRHWAYDSIARAMEKGIMLGDGQGFKPNEKLTRAMAVTVLYRMAGEPEAKQKADFTDLTQNWYQNSVSWAYSQGLVKGYGDGIFAPDSNITREELYVLMCRWASLSGKGGETILYPDDHRISPWAKDSIMQIRNRGFRSENDREIFRPSAAATRAEAAEMLCYFLENEEILQCTK